MFGFIRSIFHRHVFSIVNRYSEGDIVFWPSLVDSMVEPTLRITHWSRFYDKDTGIESVLYSGIDINTGTEWSDIDEQELQLLATGEEIYDSISPYEIWLEVKDYINEYEEVV